VVVFTIRYFWSSGEFIGAYQGGVYIGLYEIIKLKPEDYEKCNNLWNMRKNPQSTKKWFNELVEGNRIVFVYTENGEFLGEGALVLRNDDPDYTIPNKRAYISRMIVKKEHRNRGIGSIILDYLVDYAKHDEVKYVGVNQIEVELG